MFDKLWRPDLTQDEALEMMRKGAPLRAHVHCKPHAQGSPAAAAAYFWGRHCSALVLACLARPGAPHHRLIFAGIEEVKTRLVVAPPKYIIKVIDKDGIRKLADI